MASSVTQELDPAAPDREEGEGAEPMDTNEGEDRTREEEAGNFHPQVHKA